MAEETYERPTSDELGYYPNDKPEEWTLDNFYYNKDRRTWVRRPPRDPHIVFFGLPLVRQSLQPPSDEAGGPRVEPQVFENV